MPIYSRQRSLGAKQPTKRTHLRDAFVRLKTWPDAANALQKLKAKGFKLAFLSNITADRLNSGLANLGS
jgi:phosphoglycolate phosphatase-like HAD superfamily hydrolase